MNINSSNSHKNQMRQSLSSIHFSPRDYVAPEILDTTHVMPYHEKSRGPIFGTSLYSLKQVHTVSSTGVSSYLGAFPIVNLKPVAQSWYKGRWGVQPPPPPYPLLAGRPDRASLTARYRGISAQGRTNTPNPGLPRPPMLRSQTPRPPPGPHG